MNAERDGVILFQFCILL